jgi:hypothetical protein
MNARIARKVSIVVAHAWEPEPSAAYADFDRAISVGLAELISRGGNGGPRAASLATTNRRHLPYLRLLGRVIQLQSRATAQRRTWLGHVVVSLCRWFWGTGPFARKEDVIAKMTIGACPGRLGRRANIAFRR